MSRSLQEIQEGSLADSSVVNNNFEYLDGRITDVGSGITTVQSNIQSVNSTLNGRINTLNESISDLSEDVSSLQNIVYFPDYDNEITGTTTSGTYVNCENDSYVCVWGNDPYNVNVYAYVSKDNGTTKHTVGYFYDDQNAYTKGCSFNFFVPAGWSFCATFENSVNYNIWKLKGNV